MSANIPGRTFCKVTSQIVPSIETSQGSGRRWLSIRLVVTSLRISHPTTEAGGFVSDSGKNRSCVSHLLFCYFGIEMPKSEQN